MSPHDPLGEHPLTAVATVAQTRLAAGDAGALLALAGHENEVVREMLAQELWRAAEAGRDLRSALPAFERLLRDRDVGGVIFHTTRALLAAVRNGLDVSGLVPTLAKNVDEFYYPDEGWASGRDLIADNDRHSYHWGRDTVLILEQHARNVRGDG